MEMQQGGVGFTGLRSRISRLYLPQAEKFRENGNQAMKDGSYEAAILCYNQCLELTPCDVRLYTNRSLAHLNMCGWRAAELDATTALEFDQDNVKALLRRSRAREQRGDLPVCCWWMLVYTMRQKPHIQACILCDYWFVCTGCCTSAQGAVDDMRCIMHLPDHLLSTKDLHDASDVRMLLRAMCVFLGL